MWKKLIGAAAAIALSTSLAIAQTNPGLTQGQKLTPAQWNNLFASKQDTLGYTPLNTAGGVMSGRLVTAAPGASTAGLNLTPGSTPASPSNGDLWMTSSGLFARVAGVTIGPLTGSTSSSFGATAPVTVSFPSGVTTYALSFGATLVNSGGSLGVNLNNANTWTANQTFPANSINISKLVNISASRVLGSIAGGAVSELTPTQLTTLVNPFTASLSGAVNAPTTATGKFLRDDNTWQAASGTGTVTTITAGTGISLSSGATCTTTCTLTNSGVTSAVAGTNINVSAATGAVTFGITGQIAAANGGTGVASPTANTIPINNGASAQTNTGVGLTGQYVGGVTSSAPAYKSGPWTLLNTLTASNSASLSDTTSITSAYSEYEIVFQNILPATNAVDCRLRVNSGGVQTASYLGSVFFGNQSGISSTPSAPTTSVLCSGGLAHIQNSGTGLSGTCNVQNPSQTSAPKMWNCSTGYPSSVGSIENIMGAVYWNGGNGAITGIEVSMSSGNIASGTVKIYGRL